VIDFVPKQGIDEFEKLLSVLVPDPPQVVCNPGQPLKTAGKVVAVRKFANDLDCHRDSLVVKDRCFRHISPAHESDVCNLSTGENTAENYTRMLVM